METTKGEVSFGVWFQFCKKGRNPFYSKELQLLVAHTMLLWVEPFTKEQHIVVRTSLLMKG